MVPIVPHDSLLITLVTLVDRLPMPAQPSKRSRGHPLVYPDRVFLKALVIMIVRHLQTVHELLSVLAQPTAEMQHLRALLSHDGQFPSRRTGERRLKAMPATLAAQIGCLGRHLVSLMEPWPTGGRAAAIDRTVLRSRGGGSGIRSIVRKERFPTPPLTQKPIGPKPAGTAGSMAGSCTSSRSWLASGSLWRQC